MGFYGNITNTTRTLFQFDLIYPNKTEMVLNQSMDGVYIGRYILIEYDTETHTDTFKRVYIKNNVMYTSSNYDVNTKLTKGNTEKDTIVFTATSEEISSGSYPLSECAFYIITSDRISGSTAAATYKEIVSKSDMPKSNYYYNYNIDMSKEPGSGRGYDSTVWQKTYINGVEKYIMIAELNSVVPTFNIVADAPMMAPITPHFDIESTDIYYKLHWQTPWGFRVAEANGTNVTSTTNNKASLPSDEKTTYFINSYDADSGVNKSKESDSYNAAIYYNADGFKPEKKTRSTYKDRISIAPTGKSGNEYNLHTGGANNMSVQPDIMEFSFILPSLGNTISDIWDIVYSEDRNRDIGWKDSVTGAEDIELNGMTRELETIAGCINSIHDLMGMIITDKSNAIANEEWYSKHYLYQEGNTYYRIAKEITYDYPNDATVGTENGFDYHFIEVPDVAGKLSTIYGCILQMRELLGTELATDTKDRTTVQGSINVLNDLIDLFESKINPSCPVITNSNGLLSTATWTTALIGEAINRGNGNITNFETKENQWISYSIDGDNKLISIYHTTHSVDDTVTTKDINNNGDTIITYMPIVDNMGHIVGWNTETTTLPFGYKNVIVGDKSAAVADIDQQKNTLTATNTLDSITFKPSNKWIKMLGDGKTVTVSHEVHTFSDGKANTEYGLSAYKSITELDKNNTFEVPVFKFDEAGHITGARTYTIAIPENFSEIKISNNGGTDLVNAADEETLQAGTLTDKFTFNSGNRWLTVVGNKGTNTATIYHAAAGGSSIKTTLTGNETPKFGEEFKIPEVKYDEAGHISDIATHTVKIPLPSMDTVSATSASVLTGISISANEGRIIPVHDDIGNRLLTGYNNIEVNSKRITEGDSVNEAFGKAQGQLDSEVINRASAVNAEKERAETAESSLQTAIDNETRTARAAEETLTNNLATEVSNRTTAINAEQERAEKVEADLNTAINKEITDREQAIVDEVTARNEAIVDAINELDVDVIGGSENEYISSIKEENGKISATTAILPDYSDYWTRISALENELTKANEVIEQLTTDLATANDTITDILERLTKLETPSEESTPDSNLES